MVFISFQPLMPITISLWPIRDMVDLADTMMVEPKLKARVSVEKVIEFLAEQGVRYMVITNKNENRTNLGIVFTKTLHRLTDLLIAISPELVDNNENSRRYTPPQACRSMANDGPGAAIADAPLCKISLDLVGRAEGSNIFGCASTKVLHPSYLFSLSNKRPISLPASRKSLLHRFQNLLFSLARGGCQVVEPIPAFNFSN